MCNFYGTRTIYKCDHGLETPSSRKNKIPIGDLRKRQLVTAQKLDTQQCVPIALLTYVCCCYKHRKRYHGSTAWCFLVVSPLSLPTCDMQAFYIVTKFLYSQHIFMNLTNIKLKANPKTGIRADTCGQTDVHDEANGLSKL